MTPWTRCRRRPTRQATRRAHTRTYLSDRAAHRSPPNDRPMWNVRPEPVPDPGVGPGTAGRVGVLRARHRQEADLREHRQQALLRPVFSGQPVAEAADVG